MYKRQPFTQVRLKDIFWAPRLEVNRTVSIPCAFRMNEETDCVDVINLELPMPIRRVIAHEKVEADRNRVALQRGPIVYYAEGVDRGERCLTSSCPMKWCFRMNSGPIFSMATPFSAARHWRFTAMVREKSRGSLNLSWLFPIRPLPRLRFGWGR